MRRTILLAAGIGLLPFTQAMAEPWYEVEVFLFERNQPSAETWPKTPKIPPSLTGRDLIGERFRNPATAATLCSDAERAVDPLRCDGLAMQQSALNTLPSPIPTKVTGTTQAKGQAGMGLQLLDASQLQLGDLVSSVSREGGIKPLLHMGWQQPMIGRSATKPIRLLGGEDFGDRFVLNGAIKETEPQLATNQPLSLSTATDNSAIDPGLTASTQGVEPAAALTAAAATPALVAAPAVSAAAPVIQPVSQVWQLDGLIKVYLNQFIHVETDLVLRLPGTRQMAIEQLASATQPALTTAQADLGGSSRQLMPATQAQPSFEEQPFLYAAPLVQNRRIRSGQVYYFDNPKLGLIVQVRKIAEPGVTESVEEAPLEAEGDESPEGDVINQQ